jgi:hypothetical protein
MRRWIYSSMLVVGRFVFLAFAGWALSSTIAALFIIAGIAAYGDLDTALQQLPKTPWFGPVIYGYFAAVVGAAVCPIVSCLPELPAPSATFQKAARRSIFPHGAAAAVIAGVWGGSAEFWLGRSQAVTWALGCGVVVGLLYPVAVRVLTHAFTIHDESDETTSPTPPASPPAP